MSLTFSDLEKVKKLIDDSAQDTKMEIKEDLKRFATKKDLKRFATKKDLKNYATKKDLQMLQAELVDFTTKTFVTKSEFQELKEKVNLLPTKDEFLTEMDKLFFELNNIRTEMTFINERLKRHDTRISHLESIVM